MFLSLIKDINDLITNWIYDKTSFVFNDTEVFDRWQIICKTGILFLGKIQNFIFYFLSFQWLREFAYLPLSLPTNSTPNDTVSLIPPSVENIDSSWNWQTLLPNIVGQINLNIFFSNLEEDKKLFDSFFDSNNLWSLSMLYPSWFDEISTPVHFLTTSESSNLEGLGIGNLLNLAILISFSSFLNSFLMHFPISVSSIFSLRYFIPPINRFPSRTPTKHHIWPGMDKKLPQILRDKIAKMDLVSKLHVTPLSVLGIVLGEMCFLFLLILPPPFAQFSLGYLESSWPAIFGIILFTVFLLNNFESGHVFLTVSKTFNNYIKLPEMVKAFGICFFLSFTEQSCCFAYFGNLNLSSTANFFDTYLFSASLSPVLLIFSCLGFAIGSFFAITIYNFCLSKFIFFISSLLFHWKEITFSIYLKIKNFLIILSQWNFSDSVKSLVITVRNPKKTMSKFHIIRKNFKSMVLPLSLIIWNYLKSLIINFVKILNFLFLSITKRNQNQSILFFTRNSFTFPFSKKQTTFSNQSLSGSYELDQENKTNPIKKFLKNTRTKTEIFIRIDQFLVICLVSLALINIPYYSFDYLVNKFFGFIPQDQYLNRYSFHIQKPDDSLHLGQPAQTDSGIDLDPINIDLNSFDDAYYMYGSWPNSFESLNFQHELMINEKSQHDRYRTKVRRVQKEALENWKMKIFGEWKKFKNKYKQKYHSKLFSTHLQKLRQEYNTLKEKLNQDTSEPGFSPSVSLLDQEQNISKKETMKNQLSASEKKNFSQKREKDNQNLGSFFSSLISNQEENKVLKKNKNKTLQQRSLINPIKWLSKRTFRNLRLKKEENFTQNDESTLSFALKGKLTENYYKNPIYKILLSNDAKKILKNEPLSQQVRIGKGY